MDIYIQTERVIEDMIKTFSSDAAKIILYGSVSRREARPDSDIDLAVILMDELRSFPTDMEGLPLDSMSKLREVQSRHKPFDVHGAFYFESDYNNGIYLDAGRKTPPDKLNDFGRVVYDICQDL